MSSPEHQPQSDLTGHSANGRTHRRAQLAAAGALVVSVVFLVGLLFLIADDPLGIVLAFVSVFTIAFFSWFFVTTRGYRRLLAVPAVFLALAVLFTWAYDHKLTSPSSAFRPERVTTLHSTSGSTGTTSSERSTRSPTGWNGASTLRL
jgi:hypothetical protein